MVCEAAAAAAPATALSPGSYSHPISDGVDSAKQLNEGTGKFYPVRCDPMRRHYLTFFSEMDVDSKKKTLTASQVALKKIEKRGKFKSRITFPKYKERKVRGKH